MGIRHSFTGLGPDKYLGGDLPFNINSTPSLHFHCLIISNFPQKRKSYSRLSAKCPLLSSRVPILQLLKNGNTSVSHHRLGQGYLFDIVQ
jgi:hypothetical protein